jgi:integrase
MTINKTYDEDVLNTYKKTMNRLVNESKILTGKQKNILIEYRDDLELEVPISYVDEQGKLNKLKPLKSVQSIDSYIKKVINMVIYLKKDFEDITKEDIKEYRRYLKNTPITIRNGAGNQDDDRCLQNVTIEFYFTLIKTFFVWFYNKDDNTNLLPDLVKNFKIGPIKREKINQSQVLTPNEIRNMIDNCNKTRDKCFISTLYESSARSGEIMGTNISYLKIKEIMVY